MLSAPAPGYIHVYDHTFSNNFLSEKAWPIKAKFYVEPFCEAGASTYKYGLCHMTKMAAIPVYGKTLKVFCMEHWGLKLYKVYIDDDPGLT